MTGQPPQLRNPGDGVQEWIDERNRRQQTLMMQNFRQSLGTDPSFAANMQHYAQQRGWETNALHQMEPARVRELLAQNEFEKRDLARTDPILARQLQDPEFMAIAYDDLDNLSGISGWWEEMRRNKQAGALTVRQGVLADLWRQGEIDDEEAGRQLAVIQRQLRGLPAESSGFTTGFARQLGQTSETAPMLIGNMAAAAGTALAIGQLGPQVGLPEELVTVPGAMGAAYIATTVGQTAQIEAGNAYLEMVRAGYDREVAGRVAAGVGLFNGLVEGGLAALGGQVLTAPFRGMLRRELFPQLARVLAQPTTGSALRKFAVNTALGVGGEIGEELIQEVSQMVGESIARADTLAIDESARKVVGFDESFRPIEGDPTQPLDPQTSEEIADRLRSVIVQTLYQTALLSGSTSGVAFFGERMRMQRAEENYELVKDLAKLHQESQVAQRSAEKLDEFTQAASEDVELFFQADDVAATFKDQGLTEEQVEATFPGLWTEVLSAAATGDLVRVDTKTFDRVSRSEFAQALLPHVVIGSDGMSFQRAQAVREQEQQMADDYERRAASDEQVREEARLAGQEFKQQLIAAGRPEELAAAEALAYQKWVTVVGAKRPQGPMSPMEFHRAHGFGVAPPGTDLGEDPALFSQGGERRTDTPEFREFFGNSKVVDENGEPLVVYHGTTKTFEKFRAPGSGIWFALDPEQAEGGAGESSTQTMPVYVRAENPYWLTDEEQAAFTESSNPKKFIRELRARIHGEGHDALQIGDYALVAFEPTQIKSVNNRGTFDPNDPNILRAGEQGAFRPSDRMIFLMNPQNPSTILHEMAHGFLAVYEDMLAQPIVEGDRAQELARQQLLEEFQTALDWFGVKDFDAWRALPQQERTTYHEQFARGFEVFWSEGRAPTPKLRDLFRKFMRWLADFYDDVVTAVNAAFRADLAARGQPVRDLPALTDEVRDFMGLLVASRDAVKTASAARGLERLFIERPEGVTDAQWAQLQAAYTEREEIALERHARDRLRNAAWVRNTTARIDKALGKAEDGLREAVRQQVVEQRGQEPVYRALLFLRTGELIDEEGNVVPPDEGFEGPQHKLRTSVLKELRAEADLRSGPFAGLTHPEGLTPDQVAVIFGYTTGEGLLQAIETARNFDEVVAEETNARMQAEHGEFADPERRARLLDKAIMNEAQARAAAAEYRLLSGLGQPARELVIAARNTAQRLVGDRVLGDRLKGVQPRQFLHAATRAARDAQRHLAAGNRAEAAIAKRQQLLQEQMARVAIDAMEDIAKARKDFARFEKDDRKLAKGGRDVALVMAARSVLTEYGLNRGARVGRADLSKLAEVNPMLFETMQPIVDQLVAGAKPWRELTVNQFLELRDGVNALWRQSEASLYIGTGENREAIADVREKLLAEFRKFGVPDTSSATPEQREKLRARREKRSMKAWTSHVESWATQFNGGEVGGAAWRYLFDMLRKVVDDYMLEKIEKTTKLHDAVRAHNMRSGQIAADPETEFEHVFANKDELLGFLLHMGNRSNMRINLLGRGWATEENGVFDASRVWRFVRRLVDDGTLTKADFALVQFTWSLYEDMKPRAQKALMETAGHTFDEIDLQPFSVAFPDGDVVAYKGGYVPAAPDRLHEANANAREQLAQTLDGVNTANRQFQQGRRPSAEKGFTITRTGVVRPLEMALSRQIQHIDAELRFIHMGKVGRDVGALLFDPEIRSAIEAIDPGATQHMFLPWLEDTLLNRSVAPSGMPAWVDRFLNAARRNASTIFMMGNIPNAAQQVTGIGALAAIVPLKHRRAGAAIWARNPSRATTRAVDESKMMRLRVKEQMGAISDDIERLFDPNWFGDLKKWTQNNKFFLQQLIQNPVDVISWHAGYDYATAKGKDHAEAVREADSIVRQSQSSGIAVDQSAFERGTPLWRILTLFNTFWLKALNTIRYQPTAGRKARAAAVMLGYAGFMGGLISQVLRGGWEDDDEDGAVYDDFLWWSLGEVGNSAVAIGAPVAGPMVARALFDNYSVGRLSPGATWAAAESALRAVRELPQVAWDPEKDLKGRHFRDLGALFTFFTGLPFATLARPASYGFDVLEGNIEPQQLGPLPLWVDALRGAATGSASPGSRQ